MKRRRPRSYSPSTTKDEVVNLMVDFWERTGMLFTGGEPTALNGTPDDILQKIENLIEARWCHHATYEYQAEEVQQALRTLELKSEIEEARRPEAFCWTKSVTTK